MNCFAQVIPKDTLFQLEPVEIEGSRLEAFTIGARVSEVDSALKEMEGSRNLADLLNIATPIFVKSYGLGSLATTSMRGGGASHTAVLWNGFNLQSPMHGQLDFSLVPMLFVDQLSVEYGGSGALFGSGAIGGSIHLDNKANYRTGWQIDWKQHGGHFLDFMQAGRVGWSNEKWHVSTTLFARTAKNHFRYRNIAELSQPIERQAHAEVRQFGILNKLGVRLGKRDELNIRSWSQRNQRNIPPSMTVDTSGAKQQDVFSRFSVEWKHMGDKSLLFVRGAYFEEDLVYEDPTISLRSPSLNRTGIVEAENRWFLSEQWQLNVGLNNTFYWAQTVNYGGSIWQNRLAAYANAKWLSKRKRFVSVLSVREEWAGDKRWSPIVPTLTGELSMKQEGALQFKLARNYRLPTFNELYWIPGGNGDLLPEASWSQELGWVKEMGSEKVGRLKSRISLFSSQTDNWILWAPENNGIWAPSNVRKVWSRGVDFSLDWGKRFGENRIALGSIYQFVRTTNREVGAGAESSLHKQLIYVPLHSARVWIDWRYRGFSALLALQYTSKRFTTSDNSEAIRGFAMGDLKLAKQWHWNRNNLAIWLKVQNLWNTEYQAIAWFPMPRTHLLGGIDFTWKQHQ